MTEPSFSQRISDRATTLTATEQRVVDYLARNRESALFAPAMAIARAAGTSDATIIRTARKLGYGGLDALKRALASELRRELTPADRMANELVRSGGSAAALSATVATVTASLDAVGATPSALFDRAVEILSRAVRLHVFGVGPSGHIAGYFVAQIARLGVDARAMRRTGLQFADDLIGVRPGDGVMALAHDRPYAEVTALFDAAAELGLPTVLVTSGGPRLPDGRAEVTLRAPRGRGDGFALNAGVVSLLESLLVALAASRPDAAGAALERLNAARRTMSGEGVGLRRAPQGATAPYPGAGD